VAVGAKRRLRCAAWSAAGAVQLAARRKRRSARTGPASQSTKRAPRRAHRLRTMQRSRPRKPPSPNIGRRDSQHEWHSSCHAPAACSYKHDARYRRPAHPFLRSRSGAARGVASPVSGTDCTKRLEGASPKQRKQSGEIIAKLIALRKGEEDMRKRFSTKGPAGLIQMATQPPPPQRDPTPRDAPPPPRPEPGRTETPFRGFGSALKRR
jgi:hypothetical protein